MNLTLYIRPFCPYCRKVTDFLEEHDLRLPMKDISASPEARAELVRLGGKSQVPCLLIDGEALYESDEIIHWLANRADALRAS